MSTIWWPVLQQRLVELLPTLPGWDAVQVYDGPRAKNVGTSKDWVTVGWSTYGPLGGTRGSGLGDSGSFSFAEESIDTMRGENGTVLCELVTWSGTPSHLTADRQRAFDLIDALDTAIRADQRLGVLPESSTTDLSCEVIPAQERTGPTTRLIVSVNYFARS